MTSQPVTLINVFEIAPENAEEFLADWHERAEIMRRQPGFRSFRMHRALSSESRFQLVNVAEWDSTDALHAATSSERFQASMRKSAEKFAFTAQPAVYQIAFEVSA
jgi:heme oxygenase (mycobilin-producing)